MAVNAINNEGMRKLPTGAATGEAEGEGGQRPTIGYVDVNGDGYLSPADVLNLVNYLNGDRAIAEGEGLDSSRPTVQGRVADTASDGRGVFVARSESSTGTEAVGLPQSTPTANRQQVTTEASSVPAATQTDLALAAWRAEEHGNGGAVDDDLAEAVARIWSDPLNDE
jgi:hypothetical protein